MMDMANLFCMTVNQKSKLSDKKMTRDEFDHHLSDQVEKMKMQTQEPSVKRSGWSRFGVVWRFVNFGWRFASLVLVATMNCADLQVAVLPSHLWRRASIRSG